MEGRQLQHMLNKFWGRCKCYFVWKGPKSLLLLIFAIFSIRNGVRYWNGFRIYFDSHSSPGLELANNVVPIHLWAWVWILLGIWLAYSSIIKHDRIAIQAYFALCFLWALSYLYGVIALDNINIKGAVMAFVLYFHLSAIAFVTSFISVRPSRKRYSRYVRS